MAAPDIGGSPTQRNQRGQHGPICNNCGGYGFTNAMQSGASHGCPECHGTGVQPPDIYRLAADVAGLKQDIGAVLALLKEKLS